MNANNFVVGGVSTPPIPAVQRDYVRVKAISLWQPWASLIVLGEKRYETRSWRPALNRGDVLLIHAAKKWSGDLAVYCRDPIVEETLEKWGITDPKNQLPFGAALGLCRFVAAWKTDDFIPLRKERKFGDYSPGRFAWELEMFHRFDKPILMAGAQGLFSVEVPAGLVEESPHPLPPLPAAALGEGESRAAVIYVDPIVDYGDKGEWCHMWTDAGRDALDQFAMGIGLKKSWAQISISGTVGEWYHYDLRPGVRQKAIERGAVEKPLTGWIKEKREQGAPVEIVATMADEVAALESGERVARDIALLSAKKMIGLIRDECERVEIAGSVRRGKDQVKDVELVIIPKTGLLTKLDEMLANGVIKPGKNRRWGDKHRTLIYDGIDFDLFMADVDNWGFIYWLRTGPGDAGGVFMSVLNARSNYRAIDGYIWHGLKWRRDGDKWESSDRVKMSLPEERDFFALIGLAVVAPGLRTAQTYQPLWARGHVWGNPNDYKKKLVRALRVDGSRYGMLPKNDAQRWEYENYSPVLWKHNLLPLSISYYEQRIEELRTDGKSTFDLERLLEAERERQREGEEAIKKGTMRS